MLRARLGAAVAATVAAGLAVLGLAGCDSATGHLVTTSADPAHCPGRPLRVVVSVGQWSDLARHLGGACATVTTVLASAAIDPHDHEATTGDIAAFEDADLVVLNGAGYDAWAAAALANLDPRPAVVSAAAVAGVRGTGANPHLWYEPALLPRVSAAVTRALTRLSPAAGDYFAARAAAWRRDLRPYDDELAALRRLTAGRRYAATEPVFDYTARAVGLTDATPAGYRRAAGNDSDPSPGDVVAFESALSHRQVDVLVYNTQTRGSVPQQLVDTAVRAGVPVVRVTESPPRAGGSFVAWQLGQLRRLSTALGGAR